jgi:hypothetical protein
MQDSIPTPGETSESLADDLHLLRLFCQITDYEVVSGRTGEGAPDAAAPPIPATPPANREPT